ncbi:folate family ECF transporter S component [Lapidilactobacillus bayanensis]|uniref:folate family ECF transporter S component n=1 Tax=Lapidilactobacillus bayanensis TaxID=2485998 RepID=UPI000F7B2729|nr:folate family ECF transporter S component [Lapidilactobacillus bayanensis]
MNSMTKYQVRLTRLVYLAILIAVRLVVGRFAFGTSYLQLSATFLISALIGYWYGPFYAGIAGAISDVLSASLFPNGPFNPAFTVVAILSGILYGWLLDHRTMPVIKKWRVLALALLVNLGINLVLNTLLLYWMYQTPFWPLLMTRLPKELIMIPIYFFGIYYILQISDRLHLTDRLS